MLNRKNVFLTIDDAPTTDFVNKTKYLKEKNIPAVFFCEGKKIILYKNDIIEAIKKGFIIGNHSWSHADFNTLSIKKIEEEIGRTDDLIKECYYEAKTIQTIKLFRFPYLRKGLENKAYIQEYLKNLGYTNPLLKNINYNWYKKAGFDKDYDINCTYDSMDWTVADKSFHFKIKGLNDLLRRMNEHEPDARKGINSMKSDDIILMHDDERIRDFFIPMIEYLLKKHFNFGDMNSLF